MWHSQIQSHSRFRCDAKSPRYRKDICLLYILPSLTPACARAFTLLSLLCAALQVLHMHMTDDQSWPLVLSSFPELAARGAFSPNHTYTLSQLDGLIEVSVCLYFLLLLSFVFDFASRHCCHSFSIVTNISVPSLPLSWCIPHSAAAAPCHHRSTSQLSRAPLATLTGVRVVSTDRGHVTQTW
jgi:hypothetical protein